VSDDILPPELSDEELLSLAIESVAREVGCSLHEVEISKMSLTVKGHAFSFRPAINGRGDRTHWIAKIERIRPS
jgi:hypothetical protein